jgi:GNAT superfamily N-acetyltransferase
MELPKPPPPSPEGTLEIVTTYLEMLSPHRPVATSLSGRELKVMEAKRITASFYRYLYETVGEPWLWWERRAMDDDKLLSIVRSDRVEVQVLYVDGCPAGFAELDRRRGDEVELAYFGLVPAFLGQGLGPWFMQRALDLAWLDDTTRVWVHTCSLDHPRALLVYQRMGFQPYDEQTTVIDDPRAAGLFERPAWQQRR